MNDLNWILKMNMEGEIGLKCTRLWCGWKMYLVWKHRNVRLPEKRLFFAFFHHLNFMYTRSIVLSKYQGFHTKNWLPSCKASLNHSTVQSKRCHFMFANILTSSILHLILWQNKEQASFLPPKTLMAIFHCFWWQCAAIQKMKDTTFEKDRD